MVSDIELRKAVMDHERRISALESLRSTGNAPAASTKAESLTARILRLRGEGFFGQAKTALEVWQKVNAAYPCEENRVAMALLRLAERKQLRKVRKVIDNREYQAYAR